MLLLLIPSSVFSNNSAKGDAISCEWKVHLKLSGLRVVSDVQFPRIQDMHLRGSGASTRSLVFSRRSWSTRRPPIQRESLFRLSKC